MTRTVVTTALSALLLIGCGDDGLSAIDCYGDEPCAVLDDECRVGKCVQSTCQPVPRVDAPATCNSVCELDADCDDGDPCTTDTCTPDNTCDHVASCEAGIPSGIFQIGSYDQMGSPRGYVFVELDFSEGARTYYEYELANLEVPAGTCKLLTPPPATDPVYESAGTIHFTHGPTDLDLNHVNNGIYEAILEMFPRDQQIKVSIAGNPDNGIPASTHDSFFANPSTVPVITNREANGNVLVRTPTIVKFETIQGALMRAFVDAIDQQGGSKRFVCAPAIGASEVTLSQEVVDAIGPLGASVRLEAITHARRPLGTTPARDLLFSSSTTTSAQLEKQQP